MPESVTGPSGRPRSRRRVAAYAATVALAGLFTYLAVRGVNWHLAWRALAHCNAWWLVPAMAAARGQTTAEAERAFAPIADGFAQAVAIEAQRTSTPTP